MDTLKEKYQISFGALILLLIPLGLLISGLGLFAFVLFIFAVVIFFNKPESFRIKKE